MAMVLSWQMVMGAMFITRGGAQRRGKHRWHGSDSPSAFSMLRHNLPHASCGVRRLLRCQWSLRTTSRDLGGRSEREPVGYVKIVVCLDLIMVVWS
jgi:hypothetical protein